MLQPKSYIQALDADRHGGINYAELLNLNINPESILDFSVCTNPFGPPYGIKEMLGGALIDRYPDSEATALINILAGKLGVKPGNLIVGSGSTELIRMITLAYLNSEDCVLIPRPTYSDYNTASQLYGARIEKQELSEKNNFRLNVDEMLGLTKKHNPRVIFICNPNNPTGQYLEKEEISKILAEARDSLVVLDEAYINFTENIWWPFDLINHNNLIILRSMTKDYALAGLRLGYAVADEYMISVLKKVKSPWNVNELAQLAGIYAIQSEDFLEKCNSKIKEARAYLIGELRTLGLKPLPSRTNFFLVKVGNAAAVRKSLLKKGILVRDCTSFGLPSYIRLAPRTIPECQKLIISLKEIGVEHYAS